MQGTDLEVNSWVRCKTGTVNVSRPSESPLISQINSKRSAVIIEQDINTLAEKIKTNRFHHAEIAEFFERAQSEHDSILRLYFPEEI